MPQDILNILRSLIGNLGKNSERGYIHKNIVIESSDVTCKVSSLHDHLRRIYHVSRDMKAVCKIIGTACRYVAYGNFPLALHHPGYHLVQRTVPSAADNQIIIPCFSLRHGFDAVSPGLGRICGDLVTSLCKYIDNVQQIASDLCLAGPGIIDEKYFFLFHRDTPESFNHAKRAKHLSLMPCSVYFLHFNVCCRLNTLQWTVLPAAHPFRPRKPSPILPYRAQGSSFP